MKRVIRLLSLLLVCTVPGVLPVWAGRVEIERLLCFAQTNRVRIETSLKAEENLGDAEVSGRIISTSTGEPLWQGLLGTVNLRSGTRARLGREITGLRPELWSISSPHLYTLHLAVNTADGKIAERATRFGFRSFEAHDGRFWLNGHPIFLRGVAINPPGRGIPDNVGESRKFAEDYVRFLKSQNLNIFRLSTDGSQVWFDVCDELGMMLYAGRYGAPIASETPDKNAARGDQPEEANKNAPPKDFANSIAGYKELFGSYASHPSIVEYYLANELPHSGPRGDAFGKYLTKAIAELKKWDSTRPYLGNAGYGIGREGDVCDVHRYWGWYYNSFLTYYNLRDALYPEPLFGDPAKNQPLTFSECVGAFTGSSGEFNVIRSKQLAPRLGWIGHTETPHEDALEYQAFLAQQACESFRRMRPLNPRLAGLMPFTIMFYNWSGISSFDQMKPKPVMDAMRLAYQPVLLSWELWTPQVYSGATIHPVAHVINDDDANRPLTNATLQIAVRAADGSEFCINKITLPAIRHFDTWSKKLSLKLPADLVSGEYRITGRVLCGDELCSTNSAPLYIARKTRDKEIDLPKKSDIACYDPSGLTAAALTKNGIPFARLDDPSRLSPTLTALVLGEDDGDAKLRAAKDSLRQFVRGGGRILCLAQQGEQFDHSWLPQEIGFFTSSPNDADYPPRSRPFREQMNVNLERPDHPVFAGLDRRRFRLWSDYTGWDQTKPGFPKVYPVRSGFKLLRPEALKQTAVLADYDRGLEGVALCEMFDGDGSVVLSGFDLVLRAGLDPVADRLLVNLAAYVAQAAGHEPHPLVTAPIRWGDFPSERGTVCGSLNGLLPNTEWIPAPDGPKSQPLPANTGAWNMKPGEQFIVRGRQPFGEYGYSTASSLKLPGTTATTGTGFFCARLPAGKQTVVTIARNPEPGDATLTVSCGEGSAPVTVSIAGGRTETLRAWLPAGATNVCVRFSGAKTLVLEETRFE